MCVIYASIWLALGAIDHNWSGDFHRGHAPDHIRRSGAVAKWQYSNSLALLFHVSTSNRHCQLHFHRHVSQQKMRGEPIWLRFLSRASAYTYVRRSILLRASVIATMPRHCRGCRSFIKSRANETIPFAYINKVAETV